MLRLLEGSVASLKTWLVCVFAVLLYFLLNLIYFHLCIACNILNLWPLARTDSALFSEVFYMCVLRAFKVT